MLDAWNEWRARCALNLCSDDTAGRLQAFARSRFALFARRYAKRTNRTDARALVPSPRDAWHLFETHLLTSEARSGKCYKDWLFARVRAASGSPLDVVQSGATLLFRDVVREWLSREHSKCGIVSLQQPLGRDASSGFTLEDLLPGGASPADNAAMNEYDRLSAHHAKQVYAEMGKREKLAVLAKELRLSLSDPGVVRAAGCRKSVLHATYHAFLRKTAIDLKAEYADDDPESILILTLMTLHRIRERILLSKKSEKDLSGFFKKVESRMPGAARTRELPREIERAR